MNEQDTKKKKKIFRLTKKASAGILSWIITVLLLLITRSRYKSSDHKKN
ncbi:MAG: hypothetical protein LUI06_00215 [Ruminococcus sp.]|nr:hypothetical protein [Ruminococcus sp.]